MQKQVQYQIKGMQRDMSISKANSEFSFENMNIRITARENNTLFSITNEKGNKEIPLDIIIDGILLGHCVLNNYIILFSKGSTDNIYRIEYTNNNYISKLLYSGNLNFNIENPIETIGIYENENIQKVYWIDSINQPRVINIIADNTLYNNNSFDFIKELLLQETVNVSRNIVANGVFAPGVIQYAMTYYSKYGQESNIFYTSPLHYISFNNRGASPEDKVGNSFDININNIDNNFEYIRIYSIHRTSIDATPEVKRVVDLSIKNKQSIYYTDNGTTGNTIDPTELLFVGGEELVVGTMTHKDNTLFFGNLKINRKTIDKGIKEYLKGKDVTFDIISKNFSTPAPSGYYPYNNQLKYEAPEFKTFKYLEYYRFGVQFQHKSGKWSEPVWINDAYNNQNIISTYNHKSIIRLSQALYILNDQTIINQLVSDGYIKVRPLVVYPQLSDRECICQGVLCPTVYNVSDRYGNSPFVQSSWFTRPNAAYDEYKASHYTQNPNNPEEWGSDWHDRDMPFEISTNSRSGVLSNTLVDVSLNGGSSVRMDSSNKGAWAEFRHNYPIPSNNKRNAEIQCIYNPPVNPYVPNTNKESDTVKWVSENAENFYVDQSIFTMHSPDIEFDDNIRSIDTSGLKLRIIGIVPFTAFSSDIDIQTSTPPNNYKDSSEVAPGFYKEPIGCENISRFGWRGLMSGAFWFDEVSDYKADTGNTKKLTTGFVVYPWHRNGSLNNKKWATEGYRPSMLDKKKISNMRFSFNSYYLGENKIWKAYISNDNAHTGISGISMFDSNEVTLVRVPAPLYSDMNDINYYGNVDKVLNISRIGEKKDGYPIMTTGVQNAETNAHLLFSANYIQIDGKYTEQITGTDPVRMKYKSTPHAVMALNYSTSGLQNILPTVKDGDLGSPKWDVNYCGGPLPSGKFPFWDSKKSITSIYQDVLDINVGLLSFTGTGLEYGFLWLGELYNDNVVNRFGGQSEEAFENNQWVPCGKAVSLIDANGLNKTEVEIKWTEGDTYYQRYDHLKTYPFTLEDQNAVTDIISFMCETRINIDGRYDRNRGQTSNLAINPTNFNKLNPVYSQVDNFFNYRGLNTDKFNLDYFPNTITWTKEKQLGSLIDTWTNVTIASTLDLDGDKGEITSLNTFNNEIYCFQRKGFSNILFNSRVQIPTSDGVPIEISNGLKVSGKRYISNNIGCNNKWSIVESPNGIYFIDNLTNAIYLYNGQIDTLSDRLGFRQWIGDNNNLDIWNPSTFSNFVSFYDKTNDDVYFINDKSCLCFSELLGQFTSFMSYDRVPAMFNIEDKFIAFKNGKLWDQNSGDYNMFFGEYKPYYMIYKVNPDTPLDKIFNNIEFRSDTWDNDVLLNKTFDYLDVWNEYQRGTTVLDNNLFKTSVLQKKFRIWRANIPRDNANKRDRIRNPWIYLKLMMNTPNTYRTEFHDLVVNYFE